MSNPHVVLDFNPTTLTLTATVVDIIGITFEYVITKNLALIGVFTNGPSITITVDPPGCADLYQIGVLVDDTIPLLGSIILSINYLLNPTLLNQTIILNSELPTKLLSLDIPQNLTPVNIVWYYNYKPFVPTSPDARSTLVTNNGIYEISFQVLENSYTYSAVVEVVGLQPVKYIRIVDDIGFLYGFTGIPVVTEIVHFQAVNATAPYQYVIYVNGVNYSNNLSYLRVNALTPLDSILVQITDCCGFVLIAESIVLPCGLAIASGKLSAQKTVAYQAPAKHARPVPRLPSNVSVPYPIGTRKA